MYVFYMKVDVEQTLSLFAKSRNLPNIKGLCLPLPIPSFAFLHFTLLPNYSPHLSFDYLYIQILHTGIEFFRSFPLPLSWIYKSLPQPHPLIFHQWSWKVIQHSFRFQGQPHPTTTGEHIFISGETEAQGRHKSCSTVEWRQVANPAISLASPLPIRPTNPRSSDKLRFHW